MKRFAILCLAGAFGCGSKDAPQNKVVVKEKKVAVTVTPVPPKVEPMKIFAADFLKKLGAGEAKPDSLTDDFKKRVARPRNDDEKHAGFSASLAQAYLDKQAGKTFKVDAEYALTNDYMVIGTVSGGAKPEYFVLKLRIPPGMEPKVAWLHSSALRVGDRNSAQPVGPDLDAARDFMEVLLSGDELLTAALLAPDFRAALAPPHDSDKEIGYNAGLLKLKLNGVKADACSLVAGNEFGAFTGELTRDGKKIPFTLKVAGDGLVERTDLLK